MPLAATVITIVVLFVFYVFAQSRAHIEDIE